MGIFDWFTRGKSRKESRASALAMVLRRSEAPADNEAALAYLREHWSDLPAISNVETKDGIAAAAIPGGAIAISHMPVAVPPGDLEGPIACAWHWPDAAANVPLHRSHVIVFASSTQLTSIELALFHTKVVASIAATADALGVYVGDAMLVRSAVDYVAEARDATLDALPIVLWVGFNGVNEDGAASAYTTGLTRFGLLELEVRRSQQPLPEIFGFMAAAANYQLQSGKGLGDGHTFGFDATQRISVRHTRSAFLPDMTVAVLGF